MAERDKNPRRWAQESPDEPAAKLLAEALRPTLSPTQLATVRMRLDESVRAAPATAVALRWSLLPTLMAVAIGVVGGAVGYAKLHPLPAPPQRQTAEPGKSPPGQVAAVQLALLGPGQVDAGSGTVPTRLRAGALLIRTEEAPAIIEEAQARLTVPFHAIVEVVSAHGRPTLIASYVGQAVVRWAGKEQEVLLSAGHAMTVAGQVALPVGRLQRVAAWLASEDRANSLPLPPLGVEVTSAGARVIEGPAAQPDTPPEPLPVPLPRRTGKSALIAPPAGPPATGAGSLVASKRLAARPVHSAPPAPAESATKATVGSEDTVMRESALLGAAMARLRQTHDAAGALTLLESYRQQFPHGVLQPEADLIHVTALLDLGRRRDALAVLDPRELADDTPRGLELLVVRGELRAEAGRCPAAIADFDTALDQVQGELLARGLYGRSRCRARVGNAAGAQSDLVEYLRRFPDGRFSAAARQSLAVPTKNPTTSAQDARKLAR